ncbi:gfo/Idh/MocA family oxidoreductase [Bacillus sp. HMF5848]|uniref:Gfo/Idh/MocA family protein n=1 Tax=Bacillus sp. HMF5848 TaxID=2495421 RepID=UPI000F77FFD3|nr:Gfo/Idh/MocA family oxidoreductase [Bacillus sp. HMF5848]RSK28714.1 gfo/Idh/MocA family oxidoreductase [Bacillus sp. HMF5848]
MRIGTVGTSSITEKFIGASTQTNAATVTSVYSRSQEKAEAFAQKHNISITFTDLETMAMSSDIDAVYLASPNSLHFEQAKLFIKQKKHIICEKPSFSNVAEWDEIMVLAKEYGVYVFEAFRNLHAPNSKILKSTLNNAGAIRSSLFHYQKYSSRYDALLAGQEPNIFSPAFSGGALVDLGVYPISLAVYLYGPPTSIHFHPVLLKNGIDGSGTIVLTYDTHICTILYSKITDSYLANEIQGENGTITLDHVAPISSISWQDRKGNPTTELAEPQHSNDMVYEINEFVRIITEQDHEAYTYWQTVSRDVLSITEQARKQANIVFACEH